ncbi:glycosyltransferase family 2 protein [Candidatus Woesearchaeota archaeon]|nr:glycosyltransferase family 2 protein [Candidatus Woesearchaeota archaeon]
MISIVIITLNEERYLPKLLRCLVKQTYKDFEVIIVDSNSTDSTKKAAMDYKNKFDKFRFYQMKKRGVSLGRNTGARLTKNNTMFFMDADLIFENDFLEKALKNYKQKNLDVAAFYLKTNSKNIVDRAYFRFASFIFGLLQKVKPYIVGCAMISTKKVHKDIGGFDMNIKVGEDSKYMEKAFRKGYRFGLIKPRPFISSRRLVRDGRIKMGFDYVRMFFHTLFIGEIKTDKYSYRFGHYHKKK